MDDWQRKSNSLRTNVINAIAVTAHHDDPVLWCDGTILRTLHLGWKWTVVAMCVPDPQKQRYFDDYCASLNVRGWRFGFADYQSGSAFYKNVKQELRQRIEQQCDVSSFDLVFTHSSDPGGEYGGHANHDEVLSVIEETVSTERIIRFCYNPEFGYNGRGTTARRDADYHMQLNYDELLHKVTWCKRAPDAPSSLQAIGYPCPNLEGFRTTAQLGLPFIPHD